MDERLATAVRKVSAMAVVVATGGARRMRREQDGSDRCRRTAVRRNGGMGRPGRFDNPRRCEPCQQLGGINGTKLQVVSEDEI